MVATRDAVAQLIACQRAAAAAREHCEQPALGAREGDLLPVLVDKRMAGEIERASLEAQDCCRPCGFARLRHGTTGQERCEPLLVEWRREKRICPRQEAGQFGEGGALLGDDDDPAAAGTQCSSQSDACLPARHGRHDGSSQPARVTRRVRVAPSQRYGVAERLDHVGQSRAKSGLLGRNQNAHLHARLLAPSRPICPGKGNLKMDAVTVGPASFAPPISRSLPGDWTVTFAPAARELRRGPNVTAPLRRGDMAVTAVRQHNWPTAGETGAAVNHRASSRVRARGAGTASFAPRRPRRRGAAAQKWGREPASLRARPVPPLRQRCGRLPPTPSP